MKAGQEHIRSVKQVTDNRHLNYFEIEAVKRNGETFPYYMASRAGSIEELYMNLPGKGPDGVTIFALYGEKKDQVVLVRQFRYAVGDFVYELPAGLVEQGENLREAAEREMWEETGLTLHAIETGAWQERAYFMTDGMTDEACAYFMTDGMTDEACAYVYGTCEGTLSTRGLEDTEDLQVLLVDRKEAARILKEERVALSCAMMLMRFVTDEDPLAFLECI